MLSHRHTLTHIDSITRSFRVYMMMMVMIYGVHSGIQFKLIHIDLLKLCNVRRRRQHCSTLNMQRAFCTSAL